MSPTHKSQGGAKSECYTRTATGPRWGQIRGERWGHLRVPRPTVRTPDERLVWYQATTSRSSQSIKNLGIFDRWYGVLVRDDYAGYHQFDAQLAGVQQCVQHVLRHLRGVAELDADNKLWADQVAAALRDAGKLVAHANATHSTLDADALADARWRYDQGVKVGISFNLSRPWPKGNHPGLVLARRLQAKADQPHEFRDFVGDALRVAPGVRKVPSYLE